MIRTPTPPEYPERLEAVRQIVAEAERLAGASAPRVGVGGPGSFGPQSGRMRNSNSTILNGQAFPADIYVPDPGIDLPAIELAPAGPYPPGCPKRKVSPTGMFRYDGAQLHIDQRWAGTEIALTRHHNRLSVYYGAALIDTLIIGDLPRPQPRHPPH